MEVTPLEYYDGGWHLNEQGVRLVWPSKYENHCVTCNQFVTYSNSGPVKQSWSYSAHPTRRPDEKLLARLRNRYQDTPELYNAIDSTDIVIYNHAFRDSDLWNNDDAAEFKRYLEEFKVQTIN